MTLSQNKDPLLVERMLIKETVDSGRLFRVVHVDDSVNRIWLFDVNEKTWPVPYDRAALTAGFLSEPPTFAIEYDEPFVIRLSQDKTGSASDLTHDRQKNIILHLLGEEGDRNLLLNIPRKRRICPFTGRTGGMSSWGNSIG